MTVKELGKLPDPTLVGAVELDDGDVAGALIGLVGGTDETEVRVDVPSATADELAAAPAEVPAL